MTGSIDTRVERRYQQIELVRGSGDPSRGRLCVMSFVAFLAGERHSDAPACASPAIRAFAIVVNDEMPAHLRQGLKPFAPRILGTNDGRDAERLALLRHAVAQDLLPLVATSRAEPVASAEESRGVTAWLRRRLYAHVEAALIADAIAATEAELAATTAKLIAFAARRAGTPAEEQACWGRAIALLDRLCDIGTADGRRTAAPERLAWLDRSAERARRRRERLRGVLGKMRAGA